MSVAKHHELKSPKSWSLAEWVPLCLFFAISGACLALVLQHYQYVIHDAKDTARHLITQEAGVIERRLDQSVSATYALASVLRRHDMQVESEWFSSLAKELAHYYPDVDSFQFAPGGVVTYIEPLEGNIGAIGHDLLSDQARNREARAAVDSGQLTLAGPFPLLQGGWGVVARLPIYFPESDEQRTEKPQFWGFASVLMKIDVLFKNWGIRALDDLGYRSVLWRVDPTSGKPTIMAGDEIPAALDPVTADIAVPNAVWHLSATPRRGWIGGTKAILIVEAVLGLGLALLVAVFARSWIRRPLELQAEVAARTEELRVASIAFEAQEGIMVTDNQMRILRVNRSFSRLTGYDAGDVIGQTPWLLQSGRHDAAFYKELRETLARDGCWEGEIWNRKKDGELYVEWLTIAGVTDDAGVITHYVGTFTDITERKNAERLINELAFFDPLTKLPNRRLFFDRLGQAIKDSKRSKQVGATLFIDLDDFKVINDRCGHHAGDAWLCEAASRIQTSIRSQDTVARLAGDEFVVMLQNLGTDKNAAREQASRIRKKILRQFEDDFLFEGKNCRTRASIGIGLIDPSSDLDADDILKRADREMYQIKQTKKPSPANDHPDHPNRRPQLRN